MSRRVVITGMGAITPIGNTVDEFWSNIKKGVVGIGPITQIDTTDYKAKLAAEVKDFDPKEHMDPKSARRMERFAQFAVAASKQALEDSELDLEKEDPFMVGVSVGCGIGSLQCMEREYKKLLDKGPSRVSPLMIPMLISNIAAGNRMCNRKSQYWGSIPFDSVWRSGRYGCRWCRSCDHRTWCSRIHQHDSIVIVHRSDESFDSI